MSLGISILTVSAVGFLGISPLKFNINIDLTSHNLVSIDASVPLSSFFFFLLLLIARQTFWLVTVRNLQVELMIVRLFKASQFAIILK